MKTLLTGLCLVLLTALGLTGCAPLGEAGQAEPRPTIRIVVIGKSVNPYWSNVEKGVQAAGRDLGVSTVLVVPPREDAALQIQIVEPYIAQRVTGIAIAPSDPQALEQVMRQAREEGIIVTTLDTPAVQGSVSQAYIGTDNYEAGQIAGETMARLLPQGGKVGIVRGSDTALNAVQRTQGFLTAIAGSGIVALPPLNDHEDGSVALQLASSLISSNPDLAGAYGVYASNGPAWATAIRETGSYAGIKVVCFDATYDSMNGIKAGRIDAVVAQREYDMGYKSVQIIKLISEKGTPAALAQMGAVDGIIDTGVDIITASTLKAYEAALDARKIPHDWTAQGQ